MKRNLMKIAVAALAVAALQGPVGAAPAPWREVQFSAYPAKVYRGPRHAPSFTGAAKQFRMYQTELRRGFARNPLFGGQYVLVGIGCGTGCMVVYVGNVATGAISEFPVGGEEYYMMSYESRPESMLVKVKWNEMGASGANCVTEDFVYSGTTFARHRVRTTNKLCPW